MRSHFSAETPASWQLNRTIFTMPLRWLSARDSRFVVETHEQCLQLPASWLKPHLIPWNPAAAENFYKNPILAWLADNWKCIWVRQGRRDLHALHRMMQVLPQGTMTLFPEGTRSRDGSVGPGRPGPGLLVLATRPRVIPVAVEGMREVLPIGRYVPRIFQRISVSIGPPVDYAEFVTLPRTRETAQALVDRVMEAIRIQHVAVTARRRDGGS